MSALTTPLESEVPFVGPQAFKVTDGWRFFGRDREVADLIDIVAASRIVLLYSPSGAGKSSLINAAVIPQFPKRFRVMPVISVSGAPVPSPDGVRGNRYVESAVRSIENALPEAERLPADELAGIRFAAYLDRRRELAGDDRPELVIFDQFEEILTIDPFDLDAKTAFFEQVGEALRDRQRWAIFSMREEYDAQLDPWRRLVPTGLSTRFRLDLLTTDAAVEAVWKPTRDLSVRITESAAKKVVADLSQIEIEQDGTVVTRQGAYVDPVQLQVVCLRLWQKRPPDTTEITAETIDRTGTNVDVALGEYYASTVADASDETGVPERAIRTWIGDHLITRRGNRNRVLREPGESPGLDDRAIEFLIGRYLLRPVPGDATWVELAHDRLVQPVRQGNEAWFESELSPLQRQAEAWVKGGRSPDLLLHGGLLREARAWAEENRDLVTTTEREFLARSSDAHARLVWRRFVPAAVALIMIFAALAVWGFWQQRQAQNEATAAATAEMLAEVRASEAVNAAGIAETERRSAEANASAAAEARATADVARATAEAQADLSRVRALAAQAPDQHEDGDDERGALLALQAFHFHSEVDQPARSQVDEALRTVLSRRNFSVVLPNDEQALAVAFSPDGTTLAAASAVGIEDDTAVRVRLWNLMDSGAKPTEVRGLDLAAYEQPPLLAFSPDGATLAIGGSDSVRLIDTANGQLLGATMSTGSTIRAIVFSPDASMFAVVVSAPLNAESNVQVWDIDDRERRGEPANIGGAGSVIAFAPDGATLAVSTDAGIVFVDTDTGEVQPGTQPAESGVTAIAFSVDGRMFATASGPNGAIQLWTLADEDPESIILQGQESSVTVLAFSPDDQMLVAGHTDGTVQLWNTAQPGADPTVLRGHAGGVRAVAFSADGEMLATGSDDRTVRLWDLGPAAAEPFVVEEGRQGGDAGVANAVASSPDGTLRLVTHDDDSLHMRVLGVPDAVGMESLPRRGGGGVTAVAISPDGSMLATGSTTGTVQVWADGTPVAGPPNPRRTGSSEVTALAFNQDGSVLAIGGADGTVRLWSTGEQGRVTVLRIPNARVTAMAFSPDGEHLVVGGSDRRVRTYLTRRDTEPVMVQDNGWEASALVVAPDGTTLATADADGIVRLRSLAIPDAPPIVLRGSSELVTAMTFSSDGAMLFTAHADGSVRSWIARTDDLAGIVCQKVRRNLTQAEWDEFVGEQVPYEQTCANLPPGEGAPGGGTPVASPVGLRHVGGTGESG